MRGSGVLRCPRCRQWKVSFARTGETRERYYHAQGGWHGGRQTKTQHHVVCSCGYSWWSQNADAARLPLVSEPAS